MFITNYSKYLINQNATILETLKALENLSDVVVMVLFAIDSNQRIVGSITDGDVRRGLIKGISLNDSVEKLMKKSFCSLDADNIKFKDVKDLKEKSIKLVPLLKKDGTIEKLMDLTVIRSVLPISCVIMAGGEGIRMRPYTEHTPKPLLILEDKPIIVHNIDRLRLYGVKDFYISVNHMKDKIIDYLAKYYKNEDISIKFIEEEKPLGTLGSLSLANEFKYNDILVMNADLLTNIDFEDFYLNYIDKKDSMSVATFNIKIDIPYAVLNTTDKKINSLIEKPTYVYYSNAGIYLFKKEFTKLIPKNEKYDSTDLIETLIQKGKKVAHYPIRGYWLDIGKPDNYQKAQDDIRHIRF